MNIQSDDMTTVLIVDDHIPAAQMLSQIFKMHDYQVLTTDNGLDAIQIAQKKQPDIILLDVMMPGMDGYEVMEKLREIPTTQHIPIILVTAKDGVEDIEQGLGLGADDYIPKPVKPREMLARVKSKIEAHKLRNTLKKRTTELEALLRFSQELNTQHDVNSLLDLILYLISDLVMCDVAVIYYLNKDKSIRDYREQFSPTSSSSMLNPEILFEMLIEQMELMTWHDEEIVGTTFRHGLAIPLDYGEQTHGILCVLSKNHYEDHDNRLFETIARQTTLALRNAEIYENLEEMVEARTQELRSAEQLLVRSEKLASVGRLAAGIAHEINNPLMPIIMNLELMREDIQNASPISERDIEETLHSVNRIKRIVERLQQFTRGRGDDIPEMEPLSLNEVIESVMSLSSTYIRHSGISLHLDINEDTQIYGNRDQLEQVFLNIILNAHAAMEQGGDLTIRTHTDHKTAFVEVIDTGDGIAPDMIEKIFEPFFTTKETGSGLGLFISHNIIHNHSGQIEVQSVQGQGTQFIVTLPCL